MTQSKENLKIFEDKLMQKVEHSLRNLRIADLELFISAAHMKNLGKSAKFHHLSQSAASSAIVRVETAFNMPLCTHEKKQFKLTSQGQMLLAKMEVWVKEIREVIVCSESTTINIVTTHAISQIAVPALLSNDNVEFKHMRPDQAYAAILNDQADIALVLDNSPWKGVVSAEVGRGFFQLYSKQKDISIKSVLLPEDQMVVLNLQQNWKEAHGYSLPIKSRIPSWSLIAQVCSESNQVGFLPDFLANRFDLHPVIWQPAPSQYKVLAIYRRASENQQERFERLILTLRDAFK